MRTLQGAGAIVKNTEGRILLVRTLRRGMVRWELPTAVRKGDESLLMTVFRCVEEESNFSIKIRIGRLVGFGMNKSEELDHSFFGAFFECVPEEGTFRSREVPQDSIQLPDPARQCILTAQFLDWRTIQRKELHPQHYAVLEQWSDISPSRFFAVESDADTELKFYNESSVDAPVKNDPGTGSDSTFDFEVAFSFSGSHRDRIRKIAELVRAGLGQGQVFFDEWYTSDILGPDMDLRLQSIYRRGSRMVIWEQSTDYSDRRWTQTEARAIRDLQFSIDSARDSVTRLRLLKIRFGKCDGPDVCETEGWLDGNEFSPEQCAEIILMRHRTLIKGMQNE